MQDQLSGGWYMARQGTTYGPHEWTDLVAWARDGRLMPDDLVWQPQLAGWVPAGKIPGLFPTQAAGGGAAAGMATGATQNRVGSRRGLWAALAGVALVVIAGIAVGILFATGVFSEKMPLVETPMRAPTIIDVSYDLAELEVDPDEAARLEVDGVELAVPSGAAQDDTTLEVKLLDDGFNTSESIASDDQAFLVSRVVDFGPAGTSFEKPVTISLPYDEELLPAGVAEKDLVLSYWNGEAWVTTPAAIDPNRNTASATLEEFSGVAMAVVGLGTVIVGAAGVVIYKLTRSDAIIQGKAAQWVTPKDPIVQQMAQSGTAGGVKLTDQKKLAALLQQKQHGAITGLSFTAPNGAVVALDQRYSKQNTGWKKPSYYFATGNMIGDCTDVANATVSVFRSLGYPAKAMFGFVDGEPHAWGEVVIGGRVYLIDEQGGISDRDRAMQHQHLTRPDPSDNRYFMWDETGQDRLDPDWCKRYLTPAPSTTPSASSTPTTAPVLTTAPANGVLGAWKGKTGSGATFTVTFTVDNDGQMWAEVSGGTLGGEYRAWLEEGSMEIAYQGASLQGKMIDDNHVVLEQVLTDYPDMTWELSR